MTRSEAFASSGSEALGGWPSPAVVRSRADDVDGSGPAEGRPEWRNLGRVVTGFSSIAHPGTAGPATNAGELRHELDGSGFSIKGSTISIAGIEILLPDDASCGAVNPIWHVVATCAVTGQLLTFSRRTGALHGFVALGTVLTRLVVTQGEARVIGATHDGELFSFDYSGGTLRQRRFKDIASAAVMTRDGVDFLIVAGDGRSVLLRAADLNEMPFGQLNPG